MRSIVTLAAILVFAGCAGGSGGGPTRSETSTNGRTVEPHSR